jgi:hypothetical protein
MNLISITHTEPKFKSYQANLNYLALLGIYDYLFLNIDSCKVSIPLEKKYIGESVFFDLIAPINFQESVDDFFNNNMNIIIDLLKQTKAVCLYIQTKNHLIYNNFKTINTDRQRKNYYFDITLNEKTLLSNMKKDARQRLNKALRNTSFEVLATEVSLDFYQHYKKISISRGFSEKYNFSHKQFKGFSGVLGVEYLELRSDGLFVAGGFFGTNNNEVDYLYAANNDLFPDSVRLLIWSAILYFKKKEFKKIFLGGGISENDTLAVFKQRLGTFEQKCSVIMAVLNQDKAEYYAKKTFNNEWFLTFFPPYRM